MKHLKRIDELYKSTYMSASKKLKDLHPKRAEELKFHANLRGINNKIDREFPHKYYLADYWDKRDYLAKYLQPNEYLYITKIEVQSFEKDIGTFHNINRLTCVILLQSNYNNIIEMNARFTINDGKYSPLELVIDGKSIQLKKRKDAFNLKKSILEVISQDDEEYEYVKNFPINLMYKTD